MTGTPGNPLIRALQNASLYDHPVTGFEIIETHISWVLLTGEYAYKIKKPVDLGFLDFSTLDLRRHFCQQELELNRRLAPALYLDVVTITGTAEAPRFGGAGPVIDYAVKMRQFDQRWLLPAVLERGELRPDHVDQLAATLARFHATTSRADTTAAYGTPAAVWQPVQENIDQIGALTNDNATLARVQQLGAWCKDHYERLLPRLQQRQHDGFIRECHGDAHLANMTLLDDQVTLFDCLEFNPNLRWIDTMSEVAFVAMDLDDRGRADYAHRFLNAYLEHSGDYDGLYVLNFYQVYRAMVRAKVAFIRSRQNDIGPDAAARAIDAGRAYLALALRYTSTRPTPICITCGVSGTGKTSLTQPLLERLGMIRARSDIERKRLFGLAADARTGSQPAAGIYTADASSRTYERLAEIATTVVGAGMPVIIDATFLRRTDRLRFSELARQLHVPICLLHIHAPLDIVRQWIEQRRQQARDASEATLAVLERQLDTMDPIQPDEAMTVISIDSTADHAASHLIAAVSEWIDSTCA